MSQMLERAGIHYALMGGLAVIYLGGQRNTRDVDIAFQAAGKMRELRAVVEAEPRLIIPNTRLLSNLMKIFVRTGPGYDNCEGSIPVEVDLIESGYQGSPRELVGNRMALTVQTRSGPRQLNGISLLYLLRGKMAAYSARQNNTDLSDIQHLIQTYTQEIRQLIGRLDPEATEAFLEAVSPQNLAYWRSFFGR
ncbi:hypothetical protein BDW59DRAFT_176661 [Aspergillus cavernicola]|uniref:Nucleotidyl transferase AbiEii/AbiGii toxin family protein n=1 Tax=Aspergillus cavernicola TaxID=176166 RepID=A0ABR4HF09_9EURO